MPLLRRGKEVHTLRIVIGCGPIGLAVILMLKAHGVRTVIASDFSAGRRALATRCGADVIEDITTGAPLFSRVVVVGVCMGADRLRPSMAINKEIELRFVLGYTPMEFRDTLQMLADGKIDVTPLITGTVGLGGVENAFDALGDPRHTPRSSSIPRAMLRPQARRPESRRE